jgi:hypothetical protein
VSESSRDSGSQYQQSLPGMAFLDFHLSQSFKDTCGLYKASTRVHALRLYIARVHTLALELLVVCLRRRFLLKVRQPSFPLTRDILLRFLGLCHSGQ